MTDHRLMRMFLQPISRFTVLLAGIFSFMWGLWIASPFWNTFDHSPIYEVLSWTGSELLWGGVQMGVGLSLILTAFDSIKGMKWASFAGFVSWCLITLAFVFSDWHNAGIWVTGFIAAVHAHMFLNLYRQDK